MKIRFQLLDADYFLNGNKPVIRMFGRTDEGKAVCILYDRFQPYFYVKCENPHNLSGINAVNIEEVDKSLAIGYNDQKTKLYKITITNPQDVPRMREQLINNKLVEDIYEADILFKYRFMVDYGIYGMQWVEADCETVKTGISKVQSYAASSLKPLELNVNMPLKYLAFDIECVPSDPRKPLDAKKDPIVMISLAFSPEFNDKKSLVLVAKPFIGDDAKGFSSEKEMLEEFLRIINMYDPDILTGYNINSFDFPYIIERLRQNKLPQNLGRADKNTFSRTFGITQEFVLTGRAVVDPYQLLKRDPWVKFHRYDLNTVAKQLLNDKKLEIEYGEMGKFWNGTREELTRLVDYSRKDAELSMRLVVERGMLDKFIELSKISGLLLQDSMGGQTRRIETMILHEFSKKGFVMPCSPTKSELVRRTKERDKQGLKGAIVLEPRKGLHAEGCVLVLDFKSLYPSIMRTYNVSPDTLTTKTENTHQSPSGVYFIDQGTREGILPNILTRVLEARSGVKNQMKAAKGDEKRILNAKQLALKDIANSVHANTDIVVENASGNINVYEIEEFFSKLSRNHKTINVGDTEVIELTGWKTLSVDRDKSCFKPLYAISRHKPKGDLTMIKTKMGEVAITDDHSVMIMEGKSSNRQRTSRFNKLIAKGGKEVSENDIIAQVRHVQLPENEGITFNWLDFLRSLPEEETSDICLYVPKSLGLNRHDWLKNRAMMISAFNWPMDSASLQNFVERRILRSSEELLINRTGLTTVGSCGLVPVYEPTEDGEILPDFYEDFVNAKEEPNYYTLSINSVRKLPKFIERRALLAFGGAHRGRRKIPVCMHVTEELAELLGWFVAEGSTYNKNNTSFKTTISNANKQNVARIQYLIKKCLGHNASLFKNDITMGTKALYLFFRHLCGSNSYAKQVPDLILNSNSKIRGAFIRGYYSGDGNAKIHRMNTVSKRLAAQLSLMLKENGGVQHNAFDSLYRISRRQTMRGNKIVSGDLFGQQPKITRCTPSGYVYDLSVRDTEMFVTAQGLVLHNSFYGYTGYIRARLYTIDVASTITAYGRKNLEKTRKLIEDNFGLEVIYADTDSAFVKTKTTNLDEAKVLGDTISKFVTGNLPGHLELDFEKIYRTFVILTKKRYAGWRFDKAEDGWHDEIEMRGIETVRRDWCPLVSELMVQVLNIILKEGDLGKAIELVKRTIDDLRNGKIPLEKLTIIKGVTKSIESYEGMLPHIELARKLTMRNPQDPPKIGDRLGFVIVKGDQMLSKRAEDPKYVERNNIQLDSDYYIQSQLFPPVERIFSSVGIQKTEVFGTGRQVSLGDVMSGSKRVMKYTIQVNYSKPLEGWEEFLCKKCGKSYRRTPLNGLCECGGELLIGYHGSTSDKVTIK